MKYLKFVFYFFIATVIFSSCSKDEESSCTDGIRNGNETEIDCGGDCPPCPTCDDGIQNGNETGVDCGGDCPDCLDLAIEIPGIWEITEFTVNGVNAFDVFGFEAVYYNFKSNGLFESFNRQSPATNNFFNGEYQVDNDLEEVEITDTNASGSIYSVVITPDGNRITLVDPVEGVRVVGKKVTSDLCQGVDCNSGFCVYGYCECPSGNNSGNCIEIGDIGPGGGVIFYDKGSFSDGWRYLEASISDQAESAQWAGPNNDFIGNTSVAIGSGDTNTDLIRDHGVSVGSAVEKCSNLILGGKTDWFLPSRDELQVLYDNRTVVGQFANGVYWSSSEASAGSAWVVSFVNGVSDSGAPKRFGFRVRAIRKF